jgi:hypothetical protein
MIPDIRTQGLYYTQKFRFPGEIYNTEIGMAETLLEKKDLFAKIRIASGSRKRKETQSIRDCEAPGCTQKAAHKARRAEGGYWHFCLQHVTSWNRSYNYFAADGSQHSAASPEIQTSCPTTMSLNASRYLNSGRTPDDFITIVPEGQTINRRSSYRKAAPNFCATALKALDTLGVSRHEASASTIKARYKRLVKNFHPDMNDGDRSFEDRLNEIIRAYNTLQALGQC